VVPVNVQPVAVLCGLGLGVGAWMLVTLTPRLSRPSLASRVAPYVIDISDAARELLDRRTADPLPVFGVLLEPVLGTLRRAVTSLVGGSEATARRLRQAGVAWTVESFRSRQLAWSGVTAVAAIAVDVVLSLAQPIPFLAQVAFVVVAAVGGFLAAITLFNVARARDWPGWRRNCRRFSSS
jgi:tight adherence protein C